MRKPLAAAASRKVWASATAVSDKAKSSNANQFMRRSMGEPPFELLPQSHRATEPQSHRATEPQSHRATENVTECLSFDFLCGSVAPWQSCFIHPRNPRNLVGKRSRLTKTSSASASGRPSQRARVLPY